MNNHKGGECMAVEIIKKHLEGFTGDAWLVKKGDEYYVVSGTSAMFTGWEVLVFPSDENGKVTDWGDVCGGRGIDHQEAIPALRELVVGQPV